MIEKFNLNEEEIQQNYNEFIDFISKTFSGERKEKLLHMFSDNKNCLGIELATSPASLNENFHFCFNGGYLLHVMNVIKISFGVKKLWELSGANIDFSDENLIFSCICHDLGKIYIDSELSDQGRYIPQTEQWKLKKGERYSLNPELHYMNVTDASIFLLNKFGVKYDVTEFLALRLADGLYESSNEKYLVQYNPSLFLKTNLPRIIHIADYTASRAEYDKWIKYKKDLQESIINS